MNLYTKKRKGFTLIELLIVIAIIGILATIIIIALIGAQNKAKDTKLESNAHSIDTSLSQYYADNSAYPTGTDVTQNSNGANSTFSPTGTLGGAISQYLSGNGAFTFPDATAKYSSSTGGTTGTGYALVTGLLVKTYSTVSTGNGVYANTVAGVGNFSVNGITFSGISSSTQPGGAAQGFATYGPQ